MCVVDEAVENGVSVGRVSMVRRTWMTGASIEATLEM